MPFLSNPFEFEPKPIQGATNAEIDRYERALMLIAEALREPVKLVDFSTAKTRVIREMRS